jgi:hypothetical protein
MRRPAGSAVAELLHHQAGLVLADDAETEPEDDGGDDLQRAYQGEDGQQVVEAEHHGRGTSLPFDAARGAPPAKWPAAGRSPRRPVTGSAKLIYAVVK